MCLAYPGKIVKIENDVATIDYGSEKRSGKLMEKNYKVGDYVISQAGFVIQKIPEKEAKESIELFKKAIK